MGSVIRFAVGALLIYGAYCALLFMFQRSLVFPRFHVEVPSEPGTPAPGQEVFWLETSGGKVEAWFFPPQGRGPSHPAPAVIFAHGNAELIDFWPRELAGFRALGMGLLLIEYPGYGRTKGSPSQKSITEAFIAGYDRLTERPDVDPSRIVLFGRSLGGGVICALAAQRPCAAMLLLSTFTSVRSFSKGFLVPPFLVRDPFDNLSVVERYDGPILVMHGRHDELIPYDHGLALFEAARHGKMVTYQCGHNDCPPSWEMFWKDVEAFLVETGLR